MDEQRDIMDLEAAARYLDVGVTTLRLAAKAGEVPARKIGREWRFSKRALDRHLDHLGKPEDTED